MSIQDNLKSPHKPKKSYICLLKCNDVHDD